MHTDIDEKNIARRLRAAGDEPGEAPYEWAEFQRRRRPMLTRVIERNRPAAIAAAVLAALLVTAFPYIHSSHEHRPVIPPRNSVTPRNPTDLQEQERTRALEGWLAALPQDHAIVRVGAHAAVTRLQDQIAVLDYLMSAERAEGAQPTRLDALERQRSQLVNSLAQVQYAEMLASANP
ncbi:MAG TPA: hypothetical protein VMA54_13650 [Steroidobacteraceae bacterium]|nr:hypothetical protein [Steroidobacteraceae bacterium]